MMMGMDAMEGGCDDELRVLLSGHAANETWEGTFAPDASSFGNGSSCDGSDGISSGCALGAAADASDADSGAGLVLLIEHCFIGILLGFLGSVPITGPTSATVFQSGMRRRWSHGFSVGLGSSVVEGGFAAGAGQPLLLQSPAAPRVRLADVVLLLRWLAGHAWLAAAD